MAEMVLQGLFERLYYFYFSNMVEILDWTGCIIGIRLVLKEKQWVFIHSVGVPQLSGLQGLL